MVLAFILLFWKCYFVRERWRDSNWEIYWDTLPCVDRQDASSHWTYYQLQMLWKDQILEKQQIFLVRIKTSVISFTFECNIYDIVGSYCLSLWNVLQNSCSTGIPSRCNKTNFFKTFWSIWVTVITMSIHFIVHQ